MIGFRHIDRTQNAAPVGDLDVIARFLERGHVVQTLHALGGRDAQDAHAAFFGKLLEFERSEEHTSELQSLMRYSYAVFCLKQNSNVKYYKLTKISINNMK